MDAGWFGTGMSESENRKERVKGGTYNKRDKIRIG